MALRNAPLVKQAPKRITSWSYSRYNTYKQCPLKAKLKFIDKLPEPGNAAMQRGNDIHMISENFIKGAVMPAFPDELSKHKVLFTKLKKMYKDTPDLMTVEGTWAFRADWSPTAYNDWDNCVVRIKVDCAYVVPSAGKKKTLKVIDWKTGKIRPDQTEDYLEQLELYALGGMLSYKEVDKVHPSLGYLDAGVIYPPKGEDLVYTRADLPELMDTWVARTRPMLNDTIFPAKPNQFCQWCHYRKSNGGPCKY
jgi:CRISPR/Cas system-associated exonuclease Cas4 (RecB family)